MNRRRSKRIKKRLGCSLQIEGRHHSGVVIDVSATGLFVQTNARPDPGTPVSLEMSVPGAPRPLFFQAVVARQKLVPPQLVTVAQGGIGLLLQNAPEDWYGFIAGAGPQQTEEIPSGASAEKTDSPKKPAAKGKASTAKTGGSKRAKPARREVKETVRKKSEPSLIRFRLRMSQITGSRSRSMLVSATSEAEARSLAADEAGDGWKVIECTPATDQTF
jgi:hypothetical protein